MENRKRIVNGIPQGNLSGVKVVKRNGIVFES